MLELELAYENGECRHAAYGIPLVIGRDVACGLRLKSWRVARKHARIVARGGILFLEDLGSLAGTFVNGRRVNQHGPLVPGDEFIIGPCCIQVVRVPAGDRQAAHPAPGGCASAGAGQPQHAAVAPVPAGGAFVVEPPQGGNTVAAQAPQAESGGVDTGGAGERCLMSGTLADCIRETRLHGTGSDRSNRTDDPDDTGEDGGPALPSAPRADPHVVLRRRLHKRLLDALDLRRRDILQLSDEALRSEAASVLSAIVSQENLLPPDVDRERILQQVVDEAVGLGPLESLLADRQVTEIMVNFHEEIYVERGGRLTRHDAAFSSEQAVVAIIERIVAPLGRRVDESSPMVDARLRDGSRVNAVIPPIALRGACLTIRKFPERRLTMDDLLAVGSLDAHMAAFLEACVSRRMSILVSGGTGSGKTTLLNVLSNCIPAGERVITIEDAAELRLNHAHLISLESRPANAEGKGRVEIRDLVRNALRMRPDRIIVGECRGAEAFDMLSAMNTGHEGSLTTLHANSPRDALARLETMVLMAGMDLPLAAIREHVASAVDLIVQQTRLITGQRLITSIVEVTGMEAGRIQTQELFRYCGDAEPRFEGCGVQPECFRRSNAPVPLEWLNQITVLPKGGREWRSLS